MIRLVSVIGHGVNLVDHFIKHYEKYVDEINFVVYETEKYPFLANEIKDITESYDKVNILSIAKDRIYDWEKVTQLYNFAKSKHPNDWWVIADIDEFHLYPEDNLKQIINRCEENGWDVVRGGFIDRIGDNGEFAEINPSTGVSLWQQFPAAGFFRYHMSNACPNKICIVKGYVEITPGQHYAKIDGYTTWKWQGWNHPLINPIDTVQVHHFKWDSSVIDRIKDVASIKKDYAFSDEYQRMFSSIFKNKMKIDITKKEFMIEKGLIYPEYDRYRQWIKLINKIKSI